MVVEMKLNDNEIMLLNILKKSKKGIKAYRLTKMMKLRNTRDLRFLIQGLRMKGYFICGNEQGYYLGSMKELERYKSYGITILKTYFKMLRNAGNENNYKLNFQDVLNKINGDDDEKK